MFKDKFNSEMQKIKATDQSKLELLQKIETEQEKSSITVVKPSVKKRWITAVAAALALVIVSVSVLNLPIFNNISQSATKPSSTTYAEIYKKFTEIAERKDSYLDGAMGDYEDEVMTDDMFDISEGESTTNTTGTTGTTPPSENKSEYFESEEEDYSGTNVQVEEVDEADVVKTDGKYIYSIRKEEREKAYDLKITKVNNGKLEKVSEIDFLAFDYDIPEISGVVNVTNMYISKNRLAVFFTLQKNKGGSYLVVQVFDTSDPYNPKEINQIIHSGLYKSSRLVGDKIYVFANQHFSNAIEEDDYCSYVPSFKNLKGDQTPIAPEDIYILNGEIDTNYLTIFSVDINSGEKVDNKCVLGAADTVYSNTESIYIATNKTGYYANSPSGNTTHIMRFDIDDGAISAAAEGAVAGLPLNQFSMDEYDGYFRIVTTVSKAKNESKYYYTFERSNAVYILSRDLKVVGSITNIAKDESVYSVRFMGDIGYFVTFRETDPLFAVDLSNPQNPKILSALKIPGFSNYMHPWDDGLLIGFGSDAGATGKAKLSMFDISDPTNVSEKQKTIIDSYLSLGTEHKAILVSKEKDIIGFSHNGIYHIYGYNEDEGFIQKAELKVHRNSSERSYYFNADMVRGIYIGEYFYLCSPTGINSYKLSDFSKVDSLIF